MKYIIFTDKEPVFFSDTLSHKEVAGDKPVKSAGYCSMSMYINEFDERTIWASVWGESTSLGLKSDEEDEKIIESFFQYM